MCTVDMASDSHIPVLDFSQCSDRESKEKFAKNLVQVLSTVGFVYLKNHGINSDLILHGFETSKKFFDLPEEVKQKYNRPEGSGAGTRSGYVPMRSEKIDVTKREEREAYNHLPFDVTRNPTEVPDFLPALEALYNSCWAFSLELLRCLAIGLELESEDIFEQFHKEVGQAGSCTTLKTLNYPSLGRNDLTVEGITRCAVHSDYGTFTLLFQDKTGGLEVANREGEFVPVVPIDNCVLLNIANLLQRWTSGKLRSTPHQVVINPSSAGKTRQSMAFFVLPDDDCIVKCLDGSDKYPPVRTLDYVLGLMKTLY